MRRLLDELHGSPISFEDDIEASVALYHEMREPERLGDDHQYAIKYFIRRIDCLILMHERATYEIMNAYRNNQTPEPHLVKEIDYFNAEMERSRDMIKYHEGCLTQARHDDIIETTYVGIFIAAAVATYVGLS